MSENVDVLGVEVEPVDLVEQPEEGATEEVANTEALGEKEASPAAEVEAVEDKQTKGLHAAVVAERRRRQEVEAEAAELRKQLEHRAATSQRPTRDQYQDDEAFAEALVTFGAQIAQTHSSKLTEQQQYAQQVEALIASGRAKYPDFDDVINSGLAPYLTQNLHQALVRAGGVDVAHHLGKTPAEAARLSQLSPLEMAVEIGEIKATLKNTPAPKPKPVIPQTLTQARNASGQFEPAWSGPKPLDEIFTRRP